MLKPSSICVLYKEDYYYYYYYYTLHHDICEGEASVRIILRIINFCDEMPDDRRTTETCSTILRRRVSAINTQLWANI
jgi:hypothetical protein